MSLETMDSNPIEGKGEEAVEKQRPMAFYEFAIEVEAHQEKHPEAKVLIIDESWYEGLRTAYENYLAEEFGDIEEE